MRTLSIEGAEIPVLGVGTWQLHGREATEIVARALAEGYRHVDTARMYGNEEAVGRAIRDSAVPRDRIFLTTKIWPEDFDRDRFHAATDAALRALGLDHVDLLLLHWPSRSVPLEETVDALSEVVEAGKARFAGVSNFTIALFREAERLARVPLVCNQVEFHPFIRQEPLRQFLEERRRGLVCYCPLAKGRVFDEPVLRRIAVGHGSTPAQIALAWELSFPNVASIPKTGTPERLAGNLAALDIRLSGEERTEISGLASPDGRMVDLASYSPDWD